MLRKQNVWMTIFTRAITIDQIRRSLPSESILTIFRLKKSTHRRPERDRLFEIDYFTGQTVADPSSDHAVSKVRSIFEALSKDF
jgi:hypothetical protein